ncbi:50S ribosomal protein L9 [Neoehrlichia mikurensis]|uniref:Large ribosomal subunit protein bL9 n=1 Tax=Neoehrlichia mikurensis TaxID=89586 RepID=A0A9Q9F3T5_9RICK|nr:50S ribosomal protein L9 [Neoehrlichia mikurensis]QXK92932.1 50S ribosomal protein L9 [Neoehrlichia mikurensis]QXK93410.1 50S ribosomal protein L9 [Neoehrlichia mikurensis]UTO55639.1 50S ribosomal protein L9 [Neoehrlichia mikurensis]
MLSVILKESVRNLGKAGEVVKVKPGYARYLLTQKRAVRATKENLEALKQRCLIIEEENREKLAKAQAIKSLLDGKYLIIIKQASDDGKLFGSVTLKDVANLLCDQGYDLSSKDIFFSGVIKHLGDYIINIELHADLVVPIKLHVVKDESAVEEVKKLYADNIVKVQEESIIEKNSMSVATEVSSDIDNANM